VYSQYQSLNRNVWKQLNDITLSNLLAHILSLFALVSVVRGINGKKNIHSGAERMFHVLSKEDKNWKNNIYISLLSCIYCAVKFISPKGNITQEDCINLKYMGEISEQEYICLFEYAKRYNKLPRFCKKPK